MFDAHKNFTITTVATAPSPALTGLSLVVKAGTGVIFPAPPFNVVVWPEKSTASAGTVEVLRVTAITTDTLTIERKQEGSAARSIIAGDQIAVAITAKTITDIETAVGTVVTTGAPFIFGLYGAYNSFATWVPNNVIGDRGGLVAQGNGTDIAYNATGPEITSLVGYVGERIAKGLVTSIIINAGTYLGTVVPATYASSFLSIIKTIMTTYPSYAGPWLFEIINEPWEKGAAHRSNAERYGLIVKATYEAVEKAVNVDKTLASMPRLLVAAKGRYQKSNETTEAGEAFSNPEEGGGWIPDLYKSYPEGKKTINAWSSHPYGVTNTQNKGQSSGLWSAASNRQQILDNGGSGAENFYITEVGYSRGGEGITEAQQAEKIQIALETAWKWYAEGWCKGLWVFSDSDAQFGVTGKPAGTTLINFAKEHKVPLNNINSGQWPAAGVMNGPVTPVSGFTVALGEAKTISATRPAWVLATVKLNASTAASATAEVKDAGGVAEGWIPWGKATQPVGVTSNTEHFFAFPVPPGWEWRINGANATIINPSYWIT